MQAVSLPYNERRVQYMADLQPAILCFYNPGSALLQNLRLGFPYIKAFSLLQLSLMSSINPVQSFLRIAGIKNPAGFCRTLFLQDFTDIGQPFLKGGI